MGSKGPFLLYKVAKVSHMKTFLAQHASTVVFREKQLNLYQFFACLKRRVIICFYFYRFTNEFSTCPFYQARPKYAPISTYPRVEHSRSFSAHLNRRHFSGIFTLFALDSNRCSDGKTVFPRQFCLIFHLLVTREKERSEGRVVGTTD